MNVSVGQIWLSSTGETITVVDVPYREEGATGVFWANTWIVFKHGNRKPTFIKHLGAFKSDYVFYAHNLFHYWYNKVRDYVCKKG